MTQIISEYANDELVTKKINNSIALKSVSELLGKKFYIPSYQRGYRWTRQQVEDLLKDIYSFVIKKKEEKEFYCLQPTIVKYDSERACYEVIDGQQRLTTIRIILSYIIDQDYRDKSFKKDRGSDVFDIDYQTRPKSKNFLTNISEGNDENVDFLHISNAYTVTREWFESQKRPSKARNFILDALTLDYQEEGSSGAVRVIWYEIKDKMTNPIDTFIRINLGRISLTNSELIKALFLQERNLGQGNSAKLKQLEIAQQWDDIENKLQDEHFWWFLNKSENKASSHIEFIFDMMKDVAVEGDTDLRKLVGNDKFTTFRYFTTLFSETAGYEVIKENWDKIKAYFEFFVECYENPIWYHYIGFLVYCGTPIKEIYDLMNDEDNITKDDVTDKLISQIRDHQLKSIKWKVKSDEQDKRDWYIDVNYSSDREVLRRIFLLFNLEYIIKKSKQGNLVYKFPFKAFKIDKKGKKHEGSWDIEHIDSATENPLDKVEDQIIWLNNAKQDVPELKKDKLLWEGIESFLAGQKGKNFQDLYKRIRALSGEGFITEDIKNSLGNLTLLDAGTNRGYGNALFTSKRRIVIDKDKAGTFVPICTKNVFFKYFDGNSKSSWTLQDIEAYRKTIEETLINLLPSKPKTNEQI